MLSISDVTDLFETWGNDPYNETVSQVAHAEQCAGLARAAGAEDHIVVAALLHDIGHLLLLAQTGGSAQLDSDDEHEATGARCATWLFGPRVAGPIALHVAAKRYLCAVEPQYFDILSPASVASLRMQGGPMSSGDVARFRRLPHFAEAVALRRWDDEAKVRGLAVAPFVEYIPTMERLATVG
jgi:phosphonate degradation associated HDIG domain protein